MTLDYAQMFEARGHRYHAAMLAEPEARAAEFERLFDAVPVLAGQRVLDVPAGGGYLARQLGDRISVTSLELTAGFHGAVSTVDPKADWPIGRFDHVVCLAALHHIRDKPAFIDKLLGHVADGGVLHLADVALGSPLCRYLDGFVGHYNCTGHEGDYMDPQVLPIPADARVLRAAEVACPWRFTDRAHLLAFCRDLFGLDDCPMDALEESLASLVGIRDIDGAAILDWRLLYVDLQPA